MDDDNTIRNKIIVTGKSSKYNLEKLSNLELSAVYSRDKNNLIIFEKLLKKTNNKKKINILLFTIIKNINKTASIDAVKLLIKHGVDVNYRENFGWITPIYICLYSENIELTELLVENGADVNINSLYKISPLIYFIRRSPIENILEIIKLLIRKGSKINHKSNNGTTALMACFEEKFDKLIKFDIIKYLLDNKADIYIKNKKNENILKIIKDNISVSDDNNHDIYSLIFNYKNLENDHFCECDINFIYYQITN